MRKWVVLPTLILIAVALAFWWIVQPGVLTVQPIGAFPEGGTVIYHSRGPDMPLFASPDGLCLKIQGSVSLLCRGIAMAGMTPLTERIMLRLPYNHTAYLLSTDWQEFDR